MRGPMVYALLSFLCKNYQDYFVLIDVLSIKLLDQGKIYVEPLMIFLLSCISECFYLLNALLLHKICYYRKVVDVF